MTAADDDEVVFDNKRGHYATSVVIAAIIVVGVLYMALTYDNTTRGVKLFVVGIGFALAAIFLLDPILRVRIGAAAVSLERLAWKTVVPYADIANIEIQDLPVGHGREIEIIVIKRRRGFALKLRLTFEDGVIPVYSALHKRWTRWNER